uniref:SUN domain-containing protein 2-like n=1 Tax=Vespula vulgaris TaxID=7454 RepID=UPI002145742F|nr:SUN domain-containing protein 2-like [Vespula vulgaris]
MCVIKSHGSYLKQELVATSTSNSLTKKSYSISCCINTSSEDKVHDQAMIIDLSDQESMPSQLLMLSLSQLCDNDHNSYITSHAGNQYMEIHHNQSIISDTIKCQCLNKLKIPEWILSCTNGNMKKSKNSTVNIHDKTNKDTINDTIQDIYVRNGTKRLGDSDNEDVLSNKEIKQIHLDKPNELEDVCRNTDYTCMNGTIMKSVEKDTEMYKINSQNAQKTNNDLSDNESYQKEKDIELDDHVSTDIGPSDDLQNNTESCDTIIIAFSKPKFKQVLSEIKEHIRSLEKQIQSINNIIDNITVLSEQKGHLPSEKENFTIFCEKRYTYPNESQTDEFVDINNNEEQIIDKNMEESNMCKCLQKCAFSTSALTGKFSICQERIATSIDEELLKNDDTVDPEQRSVVEKISSYAEEEEEEKEEEKEEEEEELSTTEIITDITNHKLDKSQQNNGSQIDTKTAPHTNHEIEQIPLSHSHDKNMSDLKTDEVKSSVESKTKHNHYDQADCNTATSYHSTRKTAVSNHDTIYGLYLETTYTQSSNFQIVAATSISSSKLNSNTTESNDLPKSEKSTSRKIVDKSKVSPATLDISTTIDDLNPSISIQCITINLSNCQVHPQTTKIKDTSVRNIHEKVTKNKKNKKFKLRKS